MQSNVGHHRHDKGSAQESQGADFYWKVALDADHFHGERLDRSRALRAAISSPQTSIGWTSIDIHRARRNTCGWRMASAQVEHDPPTAAAGSHGWAELLTLVGAGRRLAFDRTLPPAEALGRIRDAYHAYDQQGGMQ